MVCQHKYEVVRDRGLFSNAPKWVFCPLCGDIQTPPRPREMA